MKDQGRLWKKTFSVWGIFSAREERKESVVVGEIIQYVGRKGVYGFLGRYSVRGLDRFFSLWVLRDMEVVFLKKFKPCWEEVQTVCL